MISQPIVQCLHEEQGTCLTDLGNTLETTQTDMRAYNGVQHTH